MKKLLCCTALLLVVSSAFGQSVQNEYYDAIELRSFIENGVFLTPESPLAPVKNKMDQDIQDEIKNIGTSSPKKKTKVNALNDLIQRVQKSSNLDDLLAIVADFISVDDTLLYKLALKKTYDAVLHLNQEKIAYLSILKKYYPEVDFEKDPAAAISQLNKQNNPFLESYFSDLSNLEDVESLLKLNKEQKTAGAPFTAIAGTDVTKYADAMAQFMIERAKSELTLAFFDRFKKFTEEHTEVKTLFPKTCERMGNLLTVNYRQMLNVLREAFQEDLEELPEHIFEVVEDYAQDNNIPELSLAINTLKQVKKLDYLSPVEFIAQLPNITADMKESSPEWYKNLDASLKLTTILSNSIRTNSEDRIWISGEDFYKNILSDTITKKIFIGLVYQTIKNEPITFDNKPLVESMNSIELSWWLDQMSEFISLTDKVENSIAQIKKLHKEQEPASQAQIHSYITTTLEIAAFGNSFFEHYGDGKNAFADYLSMVETANEIFRYTYEKQYGSAVMESVSLLQDIYKKIKPDQLASINDLLTATKDHDANFMMNNGNISLRFNHLIDNKIVKRELKAFNEKNAERGYSLEVACDTLRKYLKEEKKQIEADNPWVEKIITYGVFMTNMIEAETVEDAKEIIESVALPVGSSALRKNSTFSINVTSYLGGSIMQEGTWKPAITAPIGVDFGFGLKKWGALSLNVSVFDIGAIVDYRLSNDSTEIVSKINLGNILSPGVHVVYAIPKVPLSVGWGAQYGPGLSKLTSENATISISPKWHLKAFIAVDMPLLNLYNKQRKKF